MTETTITPSVVGDEGSVELLLDTDLTPIEIAELEGLELELKQPTPPSLSSTSSRGKSAHHPAEGSLPSREPGERFTMQEYLKRFTPQLTKNGNGYGLAILPAQASCSTCSIHAKSQGKSLAIPREKSHVLEQGYMNQLMPLLV